MAAVFANRLVDLAESLRRMPERGRRVKGWSDVRVVVLSPYLIFYRFQAGSNQAEVLRFWHRFKGSANAQSVESSANVGCSGNADGQWLRRINC